MNAIIGMVSNSKADKAIELLKDLTINTTRVIRDNKLINIKTEELTIDDIIYFEAGDNIYADARIIEANNLKVIESSLTGESTSVDKNVNHLWKTNTSVADRDNMVFSCSSIVNGSGKAIVTSIGMQTEIGKVASMLEEAKPQLTPLQKQLAKFGK